jgi:hypothetical protein
MYRVFPGDDHAGRSKWRRLLPHAKYLLSYSAVVQEGGDSLGLAWKSATALYNDGRCVEAELLFVQVMETKKRVLGDEHPDTLVSMGNLAMTYWGQGGWTEAEQLEVQVMETIKRVLGNEHLDTLINMNNLAFTLKCQDRSKKATSLMETFLQVRKHGFGPTHPDILSSSRTLDEWRGTST